MVIEFVCKIPLKNCHGQNSTLRIQLAPIFIIFQPTPSSQSHKYLVLVQCESMISWYKAELLTWVYSDSAMSARCVWKFTYPSVGFATYTRTHIVFFMQMYPIFHVFTRFIILWWRVSMLSGSLTSETLNFVSSGWVDLASVSPHLAIIGQQVDTSQTFPNDLDNCQPARHAN